MISLTRVISKPNLRNLSRISSKTDPGINRRKKALNLNEVENTDADDFETDFMSLHKTHREHVSEMRDMLEKEKFLIVKQKYFKEKYPNFLTWNDKEQIRYLHSTNPEEWNIEKLSEGFPALPEIIKQVVKSKWTKNPTKVKAHDSSVQKNWEMFKKGQFPNLPNELVIHLNKFTNRSLSFKPFEIPSNRKTVEVSKKNETGEFSEIITSYEKLKNKNKAETKNGEIHLVHLDFNLTKGVEDKDNHLAMDKKKVRGKCLVTLNQLQSAIESKVEKGKHLSADDKLMIKALQKYSDNKDISEIKEDLLEEITKNKYETGGSVLSKKSERDYTHLIYPEKIMIPKKVKKKGYTYRLNDCYYDDDGEFLYRVPGMG